MFIVPATNALKDFNMTAPDKAIDFCTVTLEGMYKRDPRGRVTTKKVFDQVSWIVVQDVKGRSISGHTSKGSCLMKW